MTSPASKLAANTTIGPSPTHTCLHSNALKILKLAVLKQRSSCGGQIQSLPNMRGGGGSKITPNRGVRQVAIESCLLFTLYLGALRGSVFSGPCFVWRSVLFICLRRCLRWTLARLNRFFVLCGSCLEMGHLGRRRYLGEPLAWRLAKVFVWSQEVCWSRRVLWLKHIFT